MISLHFFLTLAVAIGNVPLGRFPTNLLPKLALVATSPSFALPRDPVLALDLLRGRFGGPIDGNGTHFALYGECSFNSTNPNNEFFCATNASLNGVTGALRCGQVAAFANGYDELALVTAVVVFRASNGSDPWAPSPPIKGCFVSAGGSSHLTTVICVDRGVPTFAALGDPGWYANVTLAPSVVQPVFNLDVLDMCT